MRTFCAVATEQSFIKAAHKLGISAALTSKYVGQLEERLGVRLLNRTTRSLALTENGQAYLKRCIQLIDDFDELEASVQDCQMNPRGHLLVSAPKTFGETLLTEALTMFLDKYPDISIDLHLSDKFVNIVEDGFDLAIRFGSLKDSALIARKLTASDIVLCATPQYLENSPDIAVPDDLIGHNCIIDSNFKDGGHWPFMVEGKRITVKVSGRFRVNSSAATRTMLLKHHGIGLCPHHAVVKDLKAGRLVCLLPDFNAFDLAVYALYPHNRHLAVKVRVFIEFLVEVFAANPDLS